MHLSLYWCFFLQSGHSPLMTKEIEWGYENFTDRRQTRFDTIYTGSISNPDFRDIYAPLDGFVMNAGIKLGF